MASGSSQHDSGQDGQFQHPGKLPAEVPAGAGPVKVVTTTWKSIRESAGTYPQQAFDFVREGLQHTVGLVHGEAALREPADVDESRHVSGQQLCFGLKDFAVRRYGRLARTVLARWNIHRTDDFGRIIFSMIEAGLMRKTDDDRFEDFVGVFDFDDAFEDLDVRAHAAAS